jgi:PPP family 3-phenylpropionic acid transporter
MTSKPINKDLFFARAYYFAFMGGWGFILPFLNLFYVNLGFSGTQIGTITSTSSIVGLLFAPLIVSEIKKQSKARGILQIIIVLGALGYFLLGQQTVYLVILGIVFVHSLAVSGVMPVSDSMAVSVSKSTGSGYGSVRVFASLGWIVTVLASGWLIERFGFIAGFIGVTLMWIFGAGIAFFIQPDYFSAKLNLQLPKTNLMSGFDLHRLHEQRRFAI